MRCVNCGDAIEPGDTFCGNCGARSGLAGGQDATYAAPRLSGGRAAYREAPPEFGKEPPEFDKAPSQFGEAPSEPREAPSQLREAPSAADVTGAPGGFFSHARSRSDGRMTKTTRYLCAAAYLNPEFAGEVIREVVSSHRAVAPSVGMDLGPVLRHCLRARSMQLIRDVLLAVLLLAGLVLAPLQTILILFIAFFAGFLPGVNWGRKSAGVKIFGVAGTVVAAIVFVNLLVFLILASLVSAIERAVDNHVGAAGTAFGAPSPATGTSPVSLVWLLVLIAIIATQVTYTYLRSRTLADELGPDARPRRARTLRPQLEARIAQADAAQHGNLFLYSGRNPFVGTGRNSFIDGDRWGRAWSIAIELERDTSARPSPLGLSSPQRPQDYAPIDPVELHDVIRSRLLKLKDDSLPPNERLAGLTVEDHIVGLGQHRWESPLIDPVLSVPYSLASQEAVDALIRHPQAGLRYYQRFSVCDEGQEVWTGRGRVIDRWDQEISASAFVYAAVEGRMFYLEFVSAVMPPVRERYHVVDLLPKISAGTFLVRVIRDAFSQIFRDLIFAPVRVLRSLRALLREKRSYLSESAASRDYLYGDIGARASVREMGAARELGSYIQELDAEKYTKLAERLVNDTVLDFLAAKGVDTSAYADSASMVISNSVVIGGSASVGAAAAGTGATARASAPAQRARGH